MLRVARLSDLAVRYFFIIKHKFNIESRNIYLIKNSPVFITDGIKPRKILKKSRIGITKGTEKLWNFSFQI